MTEIQGSSSHRRHSDQSCRQVTNSQLKRQYNALKCSDLSQIKKHLVSFNFNLLQNKMVFSAHRTFNDVIKA